MSILDINSKTTEEQKWEGGDELGVEKGDINLKVILANSGNVERFLMLLIL